MPGGDSCPGSMWTRGLSSAGRAPALHAGGHRFDPGRLHRLDVCGWRQRFRPTRRCVRQEDIFQFSGRRWRQSGLGLRDFSLRSVGIHSPHWTSATSRSAALAQSRHVLVAVTHGRAVGGDLVGTTRTGALAVRSRHGVRRRLVRDGRVGRPRHASGAPDRRPASPPRRRRGVVRAGGTARVPGRRRGAGGRERRGDPRAARHVAQLLERAGRTDAVSARDGAADPPPDRGARTVEIAPTTTRSSRSTRSELLA